MTLKTTHTVAGRGQGRPTMSDVARRCGLSIKSVSRVVNGEPGVSEETAERVLEVIEELGFQRNDLARSLRQGRATGIIGVITKDPDSRFFGEVIQGIQDVTQEQGGLVLTASVPEPSKERHVVTSLLSRRIDGLLMVPTGRDHAYLATQQRLGLDLVFLDRPPVGLAADRVLFDNVGGAEAAVTHLLEKGHRRIAIVGDDGKIFTVAERVRGYRNALRRAGIPADPALRLLGNATRDEAEAATDAVMERADPPTAFFATNNVATLGIYRALKARGERRALVGFDDFPLADLLDPPVTVVAHDTRRLGATAAQLLYERMAGVEGPPRRVVVPTTLVVRASSDGASW